MNGVLVQNFYTDGLLLRGAILGPDQPIGSFPKETRCKELNLDRFRGMLSRVGFQNQFSLNRACCLWNQVFTVDATFSLWFQRAQFWETRQARAAGPRREDFNPPSGPI